MSEAPFKSVFVTFMASTALGDPPPSLVIEFLPADAEEAVDAAMIEGFALVIGALREIGAHSAAGQAFLQRAIDCPACLNSLFGMQVSATGAAESRVALKPTDRLFEVLAAIRANQFDFECINRGHGGSCPVGAVGSGADSVAGQGASINEGSAGMVTAGIDMQRDGVSVELQVW